MKKILIAALALTMALSLAACGNKAPVGTSGATSEVTSSEPATETTPATEESVAEEDMTMDEALSAVIDLIYEKEPVELKLNTPTAIDLTDANNAQYYLGLSSSDDLDSAVYSETMIGSQAYSLCLVRVKDDADADAVKQAMIDGINPAKWICVAADEVRAINSGKVVMLVLNDSGLYEGKADALCNAFVEVFGSENCGEKISK